MAVTETHNEVRLRPPPGVRFTIWGSDVVLQFERGKEREIVTWLRDWIDDFVEPIAKAHEEKVKAEEEQIAFSRSREGNRLIHENKKATLFEHIKQDLASTYPNLKSPETKLSVNASLGKGSEERVIDLTTDEQGE